MWNHQSVLVFVLSSAVSIVLPQVHSAALSISELQAGSSIRGSTIGLGATIPSASNSPQQLYWFHLPQAAAGASALADVRLTTCPSATFQGPQDAFDSSLALFNNDLASLLNASNPTSSVAQGAQDCGGKYSTLDFRIVTNKQYLLVVSSTSGASGQFILTTTIVSAPPTPPPLPWGLDRIDQRSLPLDGRFSVRGISNKDVFIYLLDSGVRITHDEFQYSDGTTNAFHGKDVVQGLDYAVDCVGHGTHVAGVIAGRSYGVAKRATIISVRVLGCGGFGYTSALISGLQFVLEDSRTLNRRPAVVSMSLIAPESSAVNSMVRQVYEQGIPVVTAAGNTNQDSCKFSPGSEPTAITVAASNRDDSRPTFSNSGSCVDIFAPGENIFSAWNTGDYAARSLSGTSSACPHVTGAAAVLLSANPNLTASAVSAMIYSAATFSVISNESGSVPSGTKKGLEANNRLLYVRPIPHIPQEESPPKGKMYIYCILEFGGTPPDLSSDCNSWLDVNSRRVNAADYLRRVTWTQGTANAVLLQACCPGSSSITPCGNAVNSSRILVRLVQNETLVSSAFDSLDISLRTKKGLIDLKEAFKTDFMRVDIEPWVVDSDGNIFWTAPNLRGESYHVLGRGAKAGIIAGVLCFCFALLVLVIVLLRRRRENNRSREFQMQVENFKRSRNNHVSVHNLSLGLASESPAEELPRSNSALEGDILVNLPSTASLRTPHGHGNLQDFGTPRTLAGSESTWNKFSSRVRHQMASPWDRRRNSMTRAESRPEIVTADREPETPSRREGNWFFSPRISSQGPGTDGIAATPTVNRASEIRRPLSSRGLHVASMQKQGGERQSNAATSGQRTENPSQANKVPSNEDNILPNDPDLQHFESEDSNSQK
jgi:Subtilase family